MAWSENSKFVGVDLCNKSGGRARLTVDRDLCRACGQNGGVKGMAKQLVGLDEVEIISPSGIQAISPKYSCRIQNYNTNVLIE